MRRRPALGAALARAVAWSVLAVAFAIPLLIAPSLRALDFSAFYCAGEAALAHADPYRAMPLGACERRVATGPMIATGVIIPSPLPPYTVALVSVLARLPFGAAQRGADVASLIALAIAILLLRKLTRLPALVVAFALAPLAWIVLALGQAVLVLLAAVVGAAYLLDRGHERWAAVVAAVTMLEPHIGLPVCVALFAWRPRTRLPLLGIGAALAVVSVGVLSWPVSAEWVTAVVPAQAHSEAGAAAQFSLTAILVFLGVPVGLALALGSLQYVVTVAAGVVIANSVARRFGEPGALALIPPLFGVLGGSYIHDYDFVLAIPAALLLARHAKFPLVAVASIIALGPIWKAAGGLPAPVLAIVGSIVLVVSVGHRRASALAVAAVLCAVVALSYHVPAKPAIAVHRVEPRALAEASWALHEQAYPMTGIDLASKAPAWLALILLCTLAVRSAVPARGHKSFV